MPLSASGQEVLKKFKDRYGSRGEEVFYRSLRSGALPSKLEADKAIDQGTPSFERIRRAVASKADDPDALSAWIKRHLDPTWSPHDEAAEDETEGGPISGVGDQEPPGVIENLRRAILAFLRQEQREPEHANGMDRARDVAEHPLKPLVPGRANDALPLASQRMALDRDSVRSKDTDGRLHVDETVVSKAAVNPYRGDEIPNWEQLGLNPAKTYWLLRDPKELAKPETVESFNGIPVLSKHQPVTVDEHPKELTIGAAGTDATWDAPHLTNSIHFWTKPDIDLVENGGKDQLSAAYRYDADMTPGVFNGVRYDGRMTNIRGNHIAVVRQGRIGPDAVIGDEAQEAGMERSRIVARLRAALRPKLAQDNLEDTIAALVPIIEAAQGNSNHGVVDQMATAPSSAIPMGSELDGWDERKLAARDAATRHAIRAADARRRLGRDEEEEEREKREAEDMAADQRMGLLPHLGGRDQVPPQFRKDKDKEEGEDQTPEQSAASAPSRNVPPAQPDLVATGGLPTTWQEPALDEAHVKAIADAAVAVAERKWAARDEAKRVVRPFVGELALALDSADEVYRTALKMLGVKVDGVHPSAFRTILELQPKTTFQTPPRIAQDSAAAKSLAERFPGFERIGRA